MVEDTIGEPMTLFELMAAHWAFLRYISIIAGETSPLIPSASASSTSGSVVSMFVLELCTRAHFWFDIGPDSWSSPCFPRLQNWGLEINFLLGHAKRNKSLSVQIMQ